MLDERSVFRTSAIVRGPPLISIAYLGTGLVSNSLLKSICIYNALRGVRLSVRYLWDEPKNVNSFAKYGIWFEEPQTVFADRNALEVFAAAVNGRLQRKKQR